MDGLLNSIYVFIIQITRTLLSLCFIFLLLLCQELEWATNMKPGPITCNDLQVLPQKYEARCFFWLLSTPDLDNSIETETHTLGWWRIMATINQYMPAKGGAWQGSDFNSMSCPIIINLGKRCAKAFWARPIGGATENKVDRVSPILVCMLWAKY